MNGRRKLARAKIHRGRKVRNLTNAKWYTTIKQSKSAELRSQKALARVSGELMMKCTIAGNNKKSIKKRTQSVHAYMSKHPEYARNKALNFHMRDPSLGIRFTTEMRENLKIRKVSQNGVQVIEYQKCARIKSTGVVEIGA